MKRCPIHSHRVFWKLLCWEDGGEAGQIVEERLSGETFRQRVPQRRVRTVPARLGNPEKMLEPSGRGAAWGKAGQRLRRSLSMLPCHSQKGSDVLRQWKTTDGFQTRQSPECIYISNLVLKQTGGLIAKGQEGRGEDN